MTTVTRFDTFARPANEAEGTDDRTVVRFFEKRKLVGEFDVEDITREDWEETLPDFIKNTKGGEPRKAPVTLEMILDFLGEEATEELNEEGPHSIVPEKYRERYGAAQNCGDEIALALTEYVTEPRKTKKSPDGGLDRAKLRGVAETNGIGDKLADWEDRGLNGGLLRMNTSNVLRGMNRRGEEVKIGSQVWPAHEVPKKTRKSRAKAKVA